MRSAAPVPLTRQSEARPILQELREIGAPTGRLLAAAKLPTSFEEPGDGFVPARSMLRFVGLAARSQGIPDLCWRGVQRARPDQLGGWGYAVARCWTLRGAILTFCDHYARDVPFVELGLEVDDEQAWFWRRRPRQVTGWSGNDDAAQFMLGAMIRVVRTAAGSRWVPAHIRTESSATSWVSAVPELAQCRIDFGSPVMALAVPRDLLDRSTRGTGFDGLQTPHSPELPSAEETLAGSLQQAIASLLPVGHLSIELAAEITQLSPRTLRRRLAEEGTSWRQVIEHARLEACGRLFRDPERSLAEIATELGYANQANLTRSFRRWTGESPSAYRRRMLVCGLTSWPSGTS